MRISDWSSDVCSSDLLAKGQERAAAHRAGARGLDRQDVEFARDQVGACGIVVRRGKPALALAALGVDRHIAIVRHRHPRAARRGSPLRARSEEHTSELQSLMRISYAVFCLKKKKTRQQ